MEYCCVALSKVTRNINLSHITIITQFNYKETSFRFRSIKILKHDLFTAFTRRFRELIIYSACQMNESSYTSTLLYNILEAVVSSDVETEQMHITYISIAVL